MVIKDGLFQCTTQFHKSLDPEEIASNRLSISEEHDSYEMRDNKRRLLMKQRENPYFGRIDFVYDGEDEAEILYIGLGGLQEKGSISNLIYDWRAPISSMYYDFDTGKAFYEAPMGIINGEITQKRQLKIRKGVMEYAIQSNFNIDDEILQKELSGNGSTKMRNIVATIQKEQNSIVLSELKEFAKELEDTLLQALSYLRHRGNSIRILHCRSGFIIIMLLIIPGGNAAEPLQFKEQVFRQVAFLI